MQRIGRIAGIVAGIVLSTGLLLPKAPRLPAAAKSNQPKSEAYVTTTDVAVEDNGFSATQLPPAQVARYAYWADQGVRFEDTWSPERVTLILSVLDRFTEALGEERFLRLINQGVAYRGTDGVAGLTFGFDPNHTRWIASWNPETGRITVSESLFDATHIAAHYRWRFLDDLTEAEPEPVSVQAFAVGHELGHMIADALREEHTARGLAPSYLEDAYVEGINLNFWANPLQQAPNESLASEIALWVYNIRRPRQARTYQAEILAPALFGEPSSVAPATPE
ncbi:MAG: hypothetical protein JXC32_14070 [Anaerolineae bacterium]|nr:hypothetical protein [Anaerolineae bacterium]